MGGDDGEGIELLEFGLEAMGSGESFKLGCRCRWRDGLAAWKGTLRTPDTIPKIRRLNCKALIPKS